MTTTSSRSAQPATGVRLRLRSREAQVTRGRFVDGGWWPYSRDLRTELPALVEAIRAQGQDVFRVSYNLAAWDQAPRRLAVGSLPVRLGGFRSQDPALITLVDTSGWKRLDIVVVPPDADPGFAEQALVMASTDGDEHHAGEMLTVEPEGVPA